MKRLVLTFAILLGLAAPAWADAADDAYKRGDWATALRKIRPLANEGWARNQHNLGYMYTRGLGVPRDYVRAHMWLSLAAAKGHPKSAKLRDAVAKFMTPAQIAEA